ncbi:MAG: DNA polymerase I [Fimbriimonadaceae bacterium]|nr:DNA polymerase I [Fimbriimonadaceae bacterium]QYK56253.1 MAG: DNA polymerase I [Fimbriimonadaceae bacterium]
MARKRLVIIDGYSLLFRSFYGTRFLSTSKGVPTNALFGFVNTLVAMLNDYKPDAIVVALDAPGKTFRHTEFSEYKGTRRETPSELQSQLAFSREMISALNIPTLELVGYEADDIIGTLSLKARESEYDTLIVSGDRDSFQLIDESVTVLMPQTGGGHKLYDVAAVVERFQFQPLQMIDYKALAGDASDNIPGVPKIGDKSATVLLEQFGTVEGIIERFDEVPPKFQKLIEPYIEQMKLSKRLATIARDAPVQYDCAPYTIDEEHVAQIRDMMESLEFKALSRRLENALGPYRTASADRAAAEVGIENLELEIKPPVTSYEELRSWVSDQAFSLVPHTESVQPSMFEESRPEYFVGLGGVVRSVPLEFVEALMHATAAQAIGHDLKPTYKRFALDGAVPRFDSMLAGYVLQSGRSGYDINDLSLAYLEVPARTPELQASALHYLEKALGDRLDKEGQTKVFKEIEMPLVPILAKMETTGIAVDRTCLESLSGSLDVSIGQCQTLVYELAGGEFNISSPKQIGEVLFEKLALPGGRKTKTGWATGAEILAEMEHPVAREIVNYRELTKLKGTYADALPKLIAFDGRIHTTYNQTVAATGRLSSNDPNLQNIPVRTELGRQIRKAFVASPGFMLASFDYSQIELRILAHMAQDPNLVEAFEKREDVHTVTASLMFHQSLEDTTKEQRRLAKLLNYAVLYGVTDFGLSNQLGEGFSRSDAAALINQYNERFPAVKAFMGAVVDEARAKGFTTTLLGRRRYFPEIHAANRGIRQYAERQAMNAPLQGTAADMIKLAMIRVARLLEGKRTRLLLQVHDELLFEVALGEEDLFGPIRKAMEDALPLNIPVEVDGKIGPNWLEMSPLP